MPETYDSRIVHNLVGAMEHKVIGVRRCFPFVLYQEESGKSYAVQPDGEYPHVTNIELHDLSGNWGGGRYDATSFAHVKMAAAASSSAYTTEQQVDIAIRASGIKGLKKRGWGKSISEVDFCEFSPELGGALMYQPDWDPKYNLQRINPQFHVLVRVRNSSIPDTYVEEIANLDLWEASNNPLLTGSLLVSAMTVITAKDLESARTKAVVKGGGPNL